MAFNMFDIYEEHVRADLMPVVENENKDDLFTLDKPESNEQNEIKGVQSNDIKFSEDVLKSLAEQLASYLKPTSSEEPDNKEV